METYNYEHIPFLRYSFHNFIAINNNLEAKRTAIELAINQNFKNNILVISGKVGIGKTHLACSILNEIKSKNTNVSLHYISFEKLFNLLLENKTNEFFNPKFLNKESVLLIDSYFSSNSSRFIELRNKLLKILIESKAKIIFTCVDEEINIECNRIELNRPSVVDEIREIIKINLKKMKMEFDADTIEFLSKIDYHSVREIEGLLISIAAISSSSKKKVDLTCVQEIYHKFIISTGCVE